jgi:hypothetical protein
MIIRIHGIFKYKKYFTISELNRKGQIFIQKCYDLEEYSQILSSEDAVIIESSIDS